MMRSTNPVLAGMDDKVEGVLQGQPMTVTGTIHKTFVLLLIAAISAAAVVFEAIQGYTDKVNTIMMIALFAGLGIGLVTSFMPKLAKFLSPIYAFAEGALLAAITLIAETQFPGIALQAVTGTFAAFFVMLFLYRTGAIRATEKFRATLMTAMITILVLYLINLIGGFFNFSIPFLVGNSPVSMLVQGVIVAVAALSLILDFDFIEKGSQNLLPKDFEWYASFGLLVTLVWLYIEILDLLARMRRD